MFPLLSKNSLRTNPFEARFRWRAFSLVEVVLAIALTTFGAVAIFSLMPVGLASLNASGRQIVEAEIFGALSAELSSTPFSDLDAFVGSRYPVYFDNEGGEVDAGGAPVFIVRCSLAPSELGNGELRRAKVSIGYHRDPDGAQAQLSKRSFLLVNKGN